jgi:hypothetical protein
MGFLFSLLASRLFLLGFIWQFENNSLPLQTNPFEV